MGKPTRKQLLDELAELRLRLEEAEDTLGAIRHGEVDALVVSGPEGERIFTLKGADHSYRLLVESINEGAATLSRDGKILYANRRLAELLRAPLEKLMGSFIHDYVAPRDREFFEAFLLRVHREDPGQEVRLRTANGAEVPTFCSLSSMVLEGFPETLALVVTDLSEQKRQEEILAAGRLSRAILDQAEQAIVVCNAKGAVTQASQAAHRLYGGNLLMQQFEEAFPLRFLVRRNSAHPASEEAFSLAAVLQGEIYQGVEGAFQRRDGQEFHVLLNAGPLLDEHGAVLGCVASLTDITARRRAEETLRRQAELLDLANDAILVRDLPGRITYWNRGAAAIYGWTPKEALGQVSYDLLQTQFPESLTDIESHVLEEGRWQGELRQTTRDGRQLVVSSRWALRRDEKGNPQSILIINTDITERKRAEEALRESEARLRMALDAAYLISFEWDIQRDEVRRFVSTDPALAPTPEQGPSTFEAVRELVHPEDRELFSAKVFAAIEHEDGRYESEFRVVHPDGKIVWLYERGLVERDKEGRPALLIGLSQDITGRKLAEEALKASEELSRSRLDEIESIYSSAPVGLCVLDRQLRYVRINERLAEINGAPASEHLGRTIREVIPDLADQAEELANRILETGQPVLGMEFSGITPAQPDVLRTWNEHWTPLKNAAGKVIGINIAAEEITQRKLAEEELRAAHERTEGILNSISDSFFALDRNLVVSYYNCAAEKTLGRKAEEVVGKRLFEAFPEARGSIFEEKYREALSTGKALTFEAYFEVPPFENWYDVRVYTFGEGLSVYFQVTNERKRAEEALRRSHDELEARVEDRTRELRMVVEHLEREIVERRQAEEELVRHAALVQDLYNNAPCGYHSLDADGTFVQINDTELAWLGYTREEMLGGRKFTDIITADSLQTFRNGFPVFLERGWMQDVEYDLVRKDGTILPVSLNATAIKGEAGQFLMSRGTIFDITERKRAEKQAQTMGRLYRVLSRINEAIVRISDQEALFQQACRIAVEEGLFRMAWVGLIDPASKSLKSIAQYGFENGYLETLMIPLEDVPEGQGPSGIAVREGRIDVCNDFAQEPRMAPWREKALALGYRSSAALPLRVRTEVVGALTLYAERPGFFTDEEITLLEGMAADLSFALESMDREAKRLKAEEAVKAERQRLFAVLETIPAYVALLAPDYTAPFVNQEFIRRFGKTEAGQKCYESLFGRLEPCPDCQTFKVLATGQPQEWEWLGPDGCTYAVYDYPFTDMDGTPLILEMGLDITKRKRAEEVIREQAQQLEAFFEHSLTPLIFLDPRFNFLRVNLAYARACQRHPVEFQGRNHFELYPDPENEAIFREVVENKRPYVAEAKAFEFPDHPEWGVTYWDWTLTPVLHENGEMAFLVFSLNDVTRRVKDQKALQESEEKLRHLSAQLMAAQESERKRLAAELHDELGHGLLTIRLQLRALQRNLLPQQQSQGEIIEGLLAFINSVLDNVRRLYYDLSPGNLEDLGLTGAVRQLIDRFASSSPGISWQVELANLDREFPLSVQTAIYRVFQELLNNIGKHAHPSRVRVCAKRDGSAACFSVEDDGRGFDLKRVLTSRKGLGLVAMEERLRLLGGALEINSRENQGTRVAFTIPCSQG